MRLYMLFFVLFFTLTAMSLIKMAFFVILGILCARFRKIGFCVFFLAFFPIVEYNILTDITEVRSMSVIDLQWFGDDGESGATKRTRMTNESNEKIAAENLAYQREWNDYQMSLNEQIMQREDTAIRRQVADARAAGVSPLAASNVGQAQTGTSVQTGSSLHNDMKYESGANPVLEKLQTLNQFVGIAGSISSQIQDLSTAFLRKDMLTEQLKGQKYSNAYRAGELYDRAKSRAYGEYYGLDNSMSEKERLIRVLGKDLLNLGGSDESLPGRLNPLDPLSAVTFPSPIHLTSSQIKDYLASMSQSGSPVKQFVEGGKEGVKKTAELAEDALVDLIEEANKKLNEYMNKSKSKSKSKSKGASGSW